jgi:two-component system chemotaxis response regulator CheY
VSRTILVVDDDVDMQQTISSILEDEGYAVVVAEDGLVALEKLEGFTPSAILLDITMPRMNGYQFAEAVAGRGLRPGIPVMVLTADGRAPEKAAHIGAEGYLKKPFSLPELISAVERILDAR